MAYRGVSENDLHAFVDGQIAPERRRELETYLAVHPGAAERVRAFFGQREALTMLRDSLARGQVEVPWTDIGRAGFSAMTALGPVPSSGLHQLKRAVAILREH